MHVIVHSCNWSVQLWDRCKFNVNASVLTFLNFSIRRFFVALVATSNSMVAKCDVTMSEGFADCQFCQVIVQLVSFVLLWHSNAAKVNVLTNFWCCVCCDAVLCGDSLTQHFWSQRERTAVLQNCINVYYNEATGRCTRVTAFFTGDKNESRH